MNMLDRGFTGFGHGNTIVLILNAWYNPVPYIITERFSVAELAAGIFLYIWALRYFLKWCRHKRIENESARPSGFLKSYNQSAYYSGLLLLILGVLVK